MRILSYVVVIGSSICGWASMLLLKNRKDEWLKTKWIGLIIGLPFAPHGEKGKADKILVISSTIALL